MNIFILLMLIMALFGLLDKMLNNYFHVATAFDNALKSMGNIAISIIGFYCIAITFIQTNQSLFTSISEYLPIDPAIFIGCLLAPDMGGFSIVQQLTTSNEMLLFAGILLSSTLGATLSFQLPIFLGALDKKEITPFIRGLLYGLLTLPAILLITAFLLPISHCILNVLPIIILCLLLAIALFLAYEKTIHYLYIFANIIKMISLFFFALVILQLFFTSLKITSIALIQEAVLIVLKMTIIVCGSMVLCELILRKGKKQINQIASLLKINDVALIGLLLSFATSLAMIPLFSKMDRKGKLMNAAFSFSGAYVLGGQLGFVASVTSSMNTNIYIIVKLAAGLLALIVTYIIENKTPSHH
ncbi:MAG: ethanolamine utilization protein EutH [Erysipelotrichia bacterium]|nr:ethanolamine utilization protein EutH [Erysipelotrichia bacterium]NCC53989.1 ethanolamine utilization protein EutH [Erysipelotrichia bacterium]